MKTKYTYFLASIAALLLFAGCQREMPVPMGPETVTVRIADAFEETRTTYTHLDGVFSWNAGDEIAVYYGNEREGNFVARAISPDSSDPAIGSFLSSSAGADLRYGFAVYPASVATEILFQDEIVIVDLPDSYDLDGMTPAQSKETAPAVLVAKNKAGEDLEFYHAGGILRAMLDEVPTGTNTVTVTFDCQVTGPFKVKVGDDYPYFSTFRSNTQNVVTFNNVTGAIATDNTLAVNIPVPCGTYNSVKVSMLNGSTELDSRTYAVPLKFERHHGKRLSFSEDVFELYLSSLTAPSNVGQDGGIRSICAEFVSYRTDGTNYFAVPFHFEYSTDDGETWEDAADGLSPTGSVTFNGNLPSDPQEINMVVDPRKDVGPKNDYGYPMSDSALRMKENEAKTDFDLSTYNPLTKAISTTRSTANCYMVDAPGTYKFPMVYGNALKNGVDNQDAYHGRRFVGGETVYVADEGEPNVSGKTNAMLLGLYKNHRDEYITSPYIREVEPDTYTAKVLWMDAAGLIKSVDVELGATPEEDYVTFEIEKGGICQGNAVIAILDSNNEIAWSWHIWVTDADISQTQSLNGYRFAPLALGRCEKLIWTQYMRQNYYVRAVQDIPGGLTSNSVRIVAGSNSTTYRYANSTLYQYGRKDPSPGDDGEYSLLGYKACYPPQDENPYYPKYGVPQYVTIAGGIKTPHIMYDGSYMFCSPRYGNLWNSGPSKYRNTGQTLPDPFDPVTKTVYDPSPVGFKVPSGEAFRTVAYGDCSPLTIEPNLTVLGFSGDNNTLQLERLSVKTTRIARSDQYHVLIAQPYFSNSTTGVFGAMTWSWQSNFNRVIYYTSDATAARPLVCEVDEDVTGGSELPTPGSGF